MRYFEKQTSAPELLLEKWKEENKQKIQEWTENKAKTGNHLWNGLGQTFGEEKETTINAKLLRNELDDYLHKEQNGLCCYCGNRIEKEKNRAIEHFLPKNKHKDLTFALSNLMLCCKDSLRSSYSIGGVIDGKKIENFKDIEQITGFPESNLRNQSKNKSLGAELKKNDKVYIPNPAHCDDSKSSFDSKSQEKPIINPSVDFELINRLSFSDNGTIDYTNKEEDSNPIIENTFEVLALNCETLIEKRKEKWKYAKIDFSDQILDISEDSEVIPFINKLKVSIATPDEDGLLEKFYFVNIAFLDSLFNAK